jgi:hypothetical protein
MTIIENRVLSKKGEFDNKWFRESSSSDSSEDDKKGDGLKSSIGLDSKELEIELQAKQKHISDLSNMLERSEDTFETVLLDVLQKAEEMLPKVICEKILLSLFSQRNVINETGIDQFTKKRIIKEKVKNLKNLVNVMELLNSGKQTKVDKLIEKENQTLICQIGKIIKKSEKLFKENKNEKREERFYFNLCQNIHDFWISIKKSEKFKEISKWKEKITK